MQSGLMGTIHITLVANAGLLLESGGRKLLLDGLHSQENGMFSPVPPCIREQIMKRIPPFDGIRWVAFTHFHEDHFDLDLVNRYLQEAAPEMLVMPKDTPYGVSSNLRQAYAAQRPLSCRWASAGAYVCGRREA